MTEGSDDAPSGMFDPEALETVFKFDVLGSGRIADDDPMPPFVVLRIEALPKGWVSMPAGSVVETETHEFVVQLHRVPYLIDRLMGATFEEWGHDGLDFTR